MTCRLRLRLSSYLHCINRDDKPEDASWLAKKLCSVRLWDDPDTKKTWMKSANDLQLEMLVVSNFTLYGYLKVITIPYIYIYIYSKPDRKVVHGTFRYMF